MKQVAILGLSYFGQAVLDELLEMDVEILLIDKDREVLDRYRDTVSMAIGMDIINQEALEKTLPKNIDAVVIDMGKNIEASILVASYCKKLGVNNIIAKAETDAHGEILGIVGATKVVFPNREAAKRIVPQIVSNLVLNYLPVGGNLVIAEIEIPDSFLGKTVLELDLRKKFGLNLISVRSADKEYQLIDPNYRFLEGDIALVSGTESDVDQFTGRLEKEGSKRGIFNSIKELFSKK
jgi:trk system potassium uptake protein TrkA